MLNLVDHDQTLKFLQGELWGGEAFEVGGVFEIEVIQGHVEGFASAGSELAGQGGLAGLAGPEQGDDLGHLEMVEDTLQKMFTIHDLG